MKEILIIKLGGILLYNNVIVDNFFSLLNKNYKYLNKNILIIHGDNCLLKQQYQNYYFLKHKEKNQEKEYFFPYFSNIVREHKLCIFPGIINRDLLLHAYKNNINAIGLCLNDGNSMVLNFHADSGNKKYTINSLVLIQQLFSLGMIPIISSVGINTDNTWVNIDADIISMLFAIYLRAKLIFLTDVNGVLDGKGNEIFKINKNDLDSFIFQGIVSDGMLLKIKIASAVVNEIDQAVYISSISDINKLEKLLYGHPVKTCVY